MVIQAIYFLVIARALGASQYGAFVGAVSLVAIAVPFSSWGMGFILIRKVSRDRTAFRRSWGDALCVTLISGGILLGLNVATTGCVSEAMNRATFVLPGQGSTDCTVICVPTGPLAGLAVNVPMVTVNGTSAYDASGFEQVAKMV